MIKSIQQFCQDGVNNLEKVMVDYSSDMTKIAEMVQGVTKGVVELGLSIIAEEWESYDELLRKRKDLRPEWYVVRKDENTLLTSLGSVRYHKTHIINSIFCGVYTSQFLKCKQNKKATIILWTLFPFHNLQTLHNIKRLVYKTDC